MQKHFKLSILVSAFVTLLVILSPRTEVANAASLSCGTWNVVSSSGSGTYSNTLFAVTAVSASDVWAVGNANNSQFISQTLIEQWNGTSWNVVASPNPGTDSNDLYGITSVSANNIWAVGAFASNSTNPQTLIEQWNGTSWNVVASPNVGSNGNYLRGVTKVSANNIWAVGYSNFPNAPQTLIEQWNGTAWNVIPSPNVSGSTQDLLYGVTAISANNIWAVGDYSFDNITYQTLVEHWDGASWNIVASPSVGTTYSTLYGLARIPGSTNLWAVGFYANTSGIYQTLIEQWNGTSWNVIASPNPAGTGGATLNSVATITARNALAVGYFQNSSGVQQTLIEQWNGTAWNIVASPNSGSGGNNLNSIARVPHSSAAWAVGYSGGGQQPLTEFNC